MQEGTTQPGSVQTGPPIHGSPVSTNAPATPDRPATADDAVRLEVVRELARDAGKLIEFVDIGRERLQTCTAALRDSAHRAAQAPWQQALRELTALLNRPIQVQPGTAPLPLVDAVDELRQWVHAFEENAAGPGGDSLHDDPVRLQKLEQRFEAVDPAIPLLLKETRQLLARQDLDPSNLDRRATAAVSASDRTDARTQAVDALLAELTGTWREQVMSLRTHLNALRSRLSQYADARTVDAAEIRERAQQGLRLVDRVPLDDYASQLDRVIEWAEHWRADERFTAQTLNARIQDELAKPIQTLRTSADELETLYGAAQFDALLDAATAQREQVETAERTTLLDAVRDRYRALVELRREKLGRNPDERYFGAPAKAVNDAISALAETELALSDAGDTEQVGRRATALLAETEEFVDPARFERYLAEQWRRLLTPLERALDEANTLRHELDDRRADLATDPRGRPSLLATFDRTVASFDAAFASARTLLDSASADHVPSQQAVTDEERKLRRALRAAAALLNPERMETELAAVQAREAQAWTGERDQYLAQLHDLARRAATYRHELDAFQAYAAAIEPYAPAVAGTVYDALTDTLSRTLTATPPLRLRDALAPATFTSVERALATVGGGTAPVVIGQLDVALGDAGALAGLIRTLGELQTRHPATSYVALEEERAALEALHTTLTDRAATAERALTVAETADTPGEALDAIRRAFDVASQPLPGRPKPKARTLPALTESRRRVAQELLFWDEPAAPTAAAPEVPLPPATTSDTASIPVKRV